MRKLGCRLPCGEQVTVAPYACEASQIPGTSVLPRPRSSGFRQDGHRNSARPRRSASLSARLFSTRARSASIKQTFSNRAEHGWQGQTTCAARLIRAVARLWASASPSRKARSRSARRHAPRQRVELVLVEHTGSGERGCPEARLAGQYCARWAVSKARAEVSVPCRSVKVTCRDGCGETVVKDRWRG